MFEKLKIRNANAQSACVKYPYIISIDEFWKHGDNAVKERYVPQGVWGGVVDFDRIDELAGGGFFVVNKDNKDYYLWRGDKECVCTKDNTAVGFRGEELDRLLKSETIIIDVSVDEPLNPQEFESNLKENGFANCEKEIYLTQGCAAYWICESLGLLSDPPRDKPEQVEYERLDRLESFVKEGAIRLYNRNACEQMQEREYDADALFLMGDLRKLVADKYPGQKLRGDDHFVVSAPLRYIEIIKQASIEPEPPDYADFIASSINSDTKEFKQDSELSAGEKQGLNKKTLN